MIFIEFTHPFPTFFTFVFLCDLEEPEDHSDGYHKICFEDTSWEGIPKVSILKTEKS